MFLAEVTSTHTHTHTHTHTERERRETCVGVTCLPDKCIYWIRVLSHWTQCDEKDQGKTDFSQ